MILGMGEDPKLTVEGCKRAIDMGVYPFVVPLRPVPGSLMQDLLPPSAEAVEAVYRQVVPYLCAQGHVRVRRRSGMRALPGVLGPGRLREGGRRHARWTSFAPAGRQRLTLAGLVCRPADGRRRTGDAPPHPARGLRRRAGLVRRLDDRDAHDADAATVHVLGLDDGSRPAPCGSTRSVTGIWKGDRLAVLPGASAQRRPRGPAGALRRGDGRSVGRRRAWWRRSSWPTCASSEALGWAAVGDPADYLGVPHQQMSIALPVTQAERGSMAEVGHAFPAQVEDVHRLVAARAAAPRPVSSSTPSDAAVRPRSANAPRHAPTCDGGQRQQEREAREARQPVGERHAVGHGQQVEVELTPSRPGSSSMASEPTSPAMLTSLAATAAPAVGQLGEQPHVAGQPAPALVERREEQEVGAHRALDAAAEHQLLAGRGVRSPTARASARPMPNADSAGGPSVRVRWPPTIGTS